MFRQIARKSILSLSIFSAVLFGNVETSAHKNDISNVETLFSASAVSIDSSTTDTVRTQSADSLTDDSSAAAASASAKIRQGSWGYDAIGASEARAAGYTGKGVKIAILDTGISAASGLKVSGGVSTVDYTTSYNDDNGHGTFVAGIIGAKNKAFQGIAPDASLYAVKVMDQDGNGSVDSLARGLQWAIDNRMNVINLSLSFPEESQSIDQLLQKASDLGIVVVAAAGNSGSADGSADTIQYPAKSSLTIAVAAVDSNLARAAFSATGSSVDLAAPGMGIVSTSVSGKYKIGEGTSTAAPFVTAAVAVLKQAYPDLTAAQIRSALQQSAVDLGASGRDSQYGYGLLSFDRLFGKNSVIAQAPASAAGSFSAKSTAVKSPAARASQSVKASGSTF
ncbi:S8 family peptidase [Saccharibacillus sp. CPCC 101409]|uniref:S8 family peptidase n=1 Tax=Saccharibacillus sp. CPCC 101409 TaxID=3058041 RepID=UPI002670F9D5|nr:S8 family peptidase [Saccharibacillus sp. CPCC 101409]MDO3410765.1 S8 family peptidase [Saccharibacillus sp. CPCC 101409]